MCYHPIVLSTKTNVGMNLALWPDLLFLTWTATSWISSLTFEDRRVFSQSARRTQLVPSCKANPLRMTRRALLTHPHAICHLAKWSPTAPCLFRLLWILPSAQPAFLPKSPTFLAGNCRWRIPHYATNRALTKNSSGAPSAPVCTC